MFLLFIIYRLSLNYMGTPKQGHTKSRRNRRRWNLALNSPSLTACAHCKKLVLPHRVCVACGYYAGTEVVDTLKKLSKKERKKKEREESLKKASQAR